MLPAIDPRINCSGSSDRGETANEWRALLRGRRTPLARFAAFALACASAFAPGLEARAAGTGDGARTTVTGDGEAQRESLETAATRLMNEARSRARRCGDVSFDAAPPLRWNSALAAAAASHSLWMQATDSTSHEQENGSTAGERAEAAGYRWRAIAENIAAGPPEVADAIAGWLDSPPHCENIMNPEFEDFGIARVRGTARNRFPTWWTLVLGRAR